MRLASRRGRSAPPVCVLEPLVGGDEEAAGAAGGSSIVKSLLARGSGWMQRTMLWISGRGVKYWPAPFLPSLPPSPAVPRRRRP